MLGVGGVYWSWNYVINLLFHLYTLLNRQKTKVYDVFRCYSKGTLTWHSAVNVPEKTYHQFNTISIKRDQMSWWIFPNTLNELRLQRVAITLLGTKYSRVDLVNFVEDRLENFWNRAFPYKFFKGCLPQNLLSPLLNTLPH